jgi:hypothetical protein
VVAYELLQKMLVPAASGVLRTGRSYSLVASNSRALRKPAVLVRDWLLEEMARERRQLSGVGLAPARARRAAAP